MSGRSLEHRWSRSALRSAVRSGDVTRVLPGLFAATEHVDSLYTRAHAATTWVGPDSVLMGRGAASAWGLCDAPTGAVIVSAAYGTHRSCPAWVRLRRAAEPLPAAEWNQCQIATPAWAAITAFADSPRGTRDHFVYRTVQRGLATPSELTAVVDSLSRLPARRPLLRVITAAAEGAESHLEALALRTVFAPREFAGFIRQHWLRVDGVAYRLDMFDAATRTAVELDGAETHGMAVQRVRDARRDARLATVGILTLRFTYGDLASRASWCREIVRRTLATRSD
jgi:very-short-patch-repair endonuclease